MEKEPSDHIPSLYFNFFVGNPCRLSFLYSMAAFFKIQRFLTVMLSLVTHSITGGWMECHCRGRFTNKYNYSMAKVNQCVWKSDSVLYRRSWIYLWWKGSGEHCFSRLHIHRGRWTKYDDWVSGLCCCFGWSRATIQEFTCLNVDRRRRWVRWWLSTIKLK